MVVVDVREILIGRFGHTRENATGLVEKYRQAFDHSFAAQAVPKYRLAAQGIKHSCLAIRHALRQNGCARQR